jgi:Putative zinc-finger
MNTMNEFHDSVHRQVWDLIPWVAAGSASNADQQQVQQHLVDCDDCRQEMAFHQDLVRGMRQHPATASAQGSDEAAEAALQRLWARVAHHSGHTATPALVAAVVNTRPPAHHTRWLMAAVLVQAVGLAALAGLLLNNWREAHYQTLSTPPATTTTAVQLRLVPAPTMPLGQLSALLALHGLQIVDSNADGTVLGLTLTPAASTPAALQALAVQLRAAPGVLLAEPTAAALGR